MMKYYVSYQNRYKGVYSLLSVGDKFPRVPDHWEEISKEECDYLAERQKRKLKGYVPDDYDPVDVYMTLQDFLDEMGVK